MNKQRNAEETGSHAGSIRHEGEDWKSNAERLARFVRENLINRDDAYGRYTKEEYGGFRSTVRVIKKPIQDSDLERHFKATQCTDLVGLHSTSSGHTCRWLVIDIDQHSDSDSETTMRNEAAVQEIVRILNNLHMPPLVMSSNGNGGFHIWVIFDRPINSHYVFNLGQMLRSKIESFNGVMVETFPKQAIPRRGGYGNLIRIFGMHHTQNFFTAVIKGNTWFKGKDAIRRICQYKLVSGEQVEQAGLAFVSETRASSPNIVENKRFNDCRHLQRFLSQLKGVCSQGSGFMACCPAHNDRHPSLSVNLGYENRILIHCFRGCTFKEVLKALGLPPSAMFTSPEKRKRELHCRKSAKQASRQVTPSKPDLTDEDFGEPCHSCDSRIDHLAQYFDVKKEVLVSLGFGYSKIKDRYTLPIFNGERKLCGICYYPPKPYNHVRDSDHPGLYLPTNWTLRDETLYVCDGLEILASMLSRGNQAIGVTRLDCVTGDLQALLSSFRKSIYFITSASHEEMIEKTRKYCVDLAGKLNVKIHIARLNRNEN
jgi:hypothetical protein